MTNYERIKNMSVEEMAEFINHETDGICGCCHPDIRFRYEVEHNGRNCYQDNVCIKGIKKWLEEESKKNE